MSIGGRTEADPGARTEARRQWRIAAANRGGWPEIPRQHLRFERFGIVVDERNDTTYRVHRGEVDQATPAVAAYSVSQAGDPVFLERVKR